MAFCDVLSVIMEYRITFIASVFSFLAIFILHCFLEDDIKMTLRYYPVVFAVPVVIYVFVALINQPQTGASSTFPFCVDNKNKSGRYRVLNFRFPGFHFNNATKSKLLPIKK